MASYSLYSPARYRAHLSSERKVQIRSMLNTQELLDPTKKSKVIATDRNGMHLETKFITKHDFKEREKVWNELLAKYKDCYIFTHW